MDYETFGNFRPVSNLSFLSKAIENVVASQLREYLQHNNLHGTESALLRVQNDVFRSIDSGHEVILLFNQRNLFIVEFLKDLYLVRYCISFIQIQ